MIAQLCTSHIENILLVIPDWDDDDLMLQVGLCFGSVCRVAMNLEDIGFEVDGGFPNHRFWAYDAYSRHLDQFEVFQLNRLDAIVISATISFISSNKYATPSPLASKHINAFLCFASEMSFVGNG